MQDQKFDLTTNAASKMLLALFVALKIKPSLSGLIEAAGQQPDVVFAALDQAVERTPQLIGNLDALLTMLRETAERNVRIEAKLDLLLEDAGYGPGDAAIANAVMRVLPAPTE